MDTVDAFTKTLNFLDVSQLAQLQRSTPGGDVRPSVPNGPKNNVRFVVRLAVNTNTNRATHYDDCGVWDSGKGSTTATTYLLSSDRLKYVSKRGEQYCTGGRTNKWIPVDPQPCPHEVVTSHRYYATLKGSNFKKRVTWFTNLPDCDGKAAVEHQGIHSGTTLPRANGTHNSRPYVRTQPETLRRVEDAVQHRNPRDELLAYTVKTKRKTTVTSTNGVLTVPARLNIAAKLGQRKRARAERARQ